MPESPSWRRREFLQASAAATAAALGCRTSTRRMAPAADRPADRPRFRTALCDLFRVEYPILQSGMGGISGSELTAAVSQAGGLGILAGAHLPPEEIRRRIQEVRRLTDRPFGVNLLLHSEMWPPVDADGIPDETVSAVQRTLNRFRERLGLPRSFARPQTRPNHIPGAIEVILEERVPVFSVGLGNPPAELVTRFHAQGAKVIAMAATVADAQAVAASGVDAVVVQGHEAGGHRSTWVKRPTAEHAHIGTMALVPQVAETLSVPVIAAGGIATGRGIVAALALGADGALLGTRFMATRESLARSHQNRVLVERDSDATTVTDAFTGLYARALRNTFTVEYAGSGAPVLPGYLQQDAARDILNAARDREDPEYASILAGQSVGMIHDVPAAGDVVAALVREAQAAMSSLRAAVELT